MKCEMIVRVMKDGYCKTFERFTQKTIKGVFNQYKKIDNTGLGGLFFKDYHEADCIEFVRTPDGYHEEQRPCVMYTSDEFFAIIGK